MHRVQVGVFRRRQVNFKRLAWLLRHNGHYLQPKPIHVPAAYDGALPETHVKQPVSVTVLIRGIISHGGYVQTASTDEARIPGSGIVTIK